MKLRVTFAALFTCYLSSCNAEEQLRRRKLVEADRWLGSMSDNSSGGSKGSKGGPSAIPTPGPTPSMPPSPAEMGGKGGKGSKVSKSDISSGGIKGSKGGPFTIPTPGPMHSVMLANAEMGGKGSKGSMSNDSSGGSKSKGSKGGPSTRPTPRPMLSMTPTPAECPNSSYDDEAFQEALALKDEVQVELAWFPFELYANIFGELPPSVASASDLLCQSKLPPSYPLPLYTLKAEFTDVPEQLGVKLSALNENGTEFLVQFDEILARFTSFGVASYALKTTVKMNNGDGPDLDSSILSVVQLSSLLMIGDLLWYERFIPFDADNIVFPYETTVGATTTLDASTTVGASSLEAKEPFFRPHPCDAVIDPKLNPVELCYDRMMWPSFNARCIRDYDKDFASEVADEKAKYLSAITATNDDFRVKQQLQQLVYASQMAESFSRCNRLNYLDFDEILPCFSSDFKRSIDQIANGLPNKNMPLVGLFRNMNIAEAGLRKVEAQVCKLLSSQLDNCFVCDSNAPFGIDELKGKLCQVGAKDCSPCVESVEEQHEQINISSRDQSFRMKQAKISPVDRHIQGVGRLRDSSLGGRMVITENGKRSGYGFHLAFNDTSPNSEGIFSLNQDGRDRIAFKIKDVKAYGKHQHPGGLQAHGDFVVIAMEGGAYPAAYVLKVRGDEIEFLHSVEVRQAGRGGKAASAGFVRLDDNRFLLAVSGADNGTEGIRFFVTIGSTLDANTEWNYIGISRPGTGICNDAGCVKQSLANETFSAFFGAGGGLNFVTDCNQDLYLIAMGGDASLLNGCHQWDQVFKVSAAGPERRSNKDLVHLEKVGEKYTNLGDPYLQECFRWAGGVAVSSDNRMVLMNMERRRLIKENAWMDGELFFVPQIPGPIV